METKILILDDPELQTQYTLKLSTEDYERVLNGKFLTEIDHIGILFLK